MTFLYCADLHGKLKNPISRLDNYAKSWIEKIKEIQQIAIDNNCSCIIVNGDVFDTPHVSNVLIDDFLDIIENQHTDKKVFWRIVVGNHDLIGANWKNSKASALAHIFRRSKFVDKLDTIETKDYLIRGYDYYYGIEEDLKEKGLFIKRTQKQFCIAIPHALITIKPFFENVSQVLAKEFETNYDLILCGHLHTNFHKKINNIEFFNPNCIGRTAINEQHLLQVAIIDTNIREIKTINLRSCKKTDDIFDLSKYEELKANKKDIKEFLDSLKDANFQSMSIAEQIVKIGKEQKVEQNIINYLLEKIGETKDE